MFVLRFFYIFKNLLYFYFFFVQWNVTFIPTAPFVLYIIEHFGIFIENIFNSLHNAEILSVIWSFFSSGVNLFTGNLSILLTFQVFDVLENEKAALQLSQTVIAVLFTCTTLLFQHISYWLWSDYSFL